MFEEVVQTEVALANMELEKLDKAASKNNKSAGKKSLLQRMSTFKMNLQFMRGKGEGRVTSKTFEKLSSSMGSISDASSSKEELSAQ